MSEDKEEKYVDMAKDPRFRKQIESQESVEMCRELSQLIRKYGSTGKISIAVIVHCLFSAIFSLLYKNNIRGDRLADTVTGFTNYHLITAEKYDKHGGFDTERKKE